MTSRSRSNRSRASVILPAAWYAWPRLFSESMAWGRQVPVFLHLGVPHLLEQGDSLDLFPGEQISASEVAEGSQGSSIVGPEFLLTCVPHLFQERDGLGRFPGKCVSPGQIILGCKGGQMVGPEFIQLGVPYLLESRT